MILFIHGFGSCGWGSKSLALRQYFGVDRVLAPDLPFDPDQAMRHLIGLRERYPIGARVGSSLGGFYATWLNRFDPLPTVLVNPAMRPHHKLRPYTGSHRRWCDDMPFEVGSDYLEALRRLERPQLDPEERYLVLIQQGDEVLDYREAADYYRHKDLRVFPGGSHRFDGFSDRLAEIRRWIDGVDPNRHAENTQGTA